MKCKQGVKLFGCSPQILATMPIADAIWKELGAEEAVVTSGSEQTARHGRASEHYSGNALDYRIWNLVESHRKRAADKLRDSLTDEFDVTLEEDHIHCEFQPKRNN